MPPAPLPACIRQVGPKVAITIQAKPNAKVSAVGAHDEEALSVAIAAPPREGEANATLCEYIAEVLGLKRRQVSLDRGSKSRHKVLLVEDLDAATVWDRLRGAQPP
eukprot:EG_transcript_30171